MGVINHHGNAISGKPPCDGSTDTLRCPGYDSRPEILVCHGLSPLDESEIGARPD
jgi:hypothetical protein